MFKSDTSFSFNIIYPSVVFSQPIILIFYQNKNFRKPPGFTQKFSNKNPSLILKIFQKSKKPHIVWLFLVEINGLEPMTS